MKLLVGYTGFVGSNLDMETSFNGRYNSKNIQEAYGISPDLLVYAGLPAAKYLANSAPEKDMAQILNAENNILKIAPKQLVLISTIDVFKNPVGVYEDTLVDTKGLSAYGLNRYRLEEWVREHYPEALIVRLPGLFGKNIKKNFIYDFIHRIPFMLKEDKMAELSAKEPRLAAYYERQGNGFYRVKLLTAAGEAELKELLEQVHFSALQFTDSRSIYQFYPLTRLWKDIETALAHHITLLHLATEPVSAGEVYHFLTGESFHNELPGMPANYDYRTRNSRVFGRAGERYILGKDQILQAILNFVYNIHKESIQ